MSVIAANLQAVRKRITACIQMVHQQKAGNQTCPRLIAVSKTFPAEAVIEAMLAGQLDFGENYVQEAVKKMERVRQLYHRLNLVWHYIGPIQSNKTRTIAEHFDWVHSVDRLKIAQRLSEQRPLHLSPLKILIQVNISAEASKSGVVPAETLALAQAITHLPRLKFCGLMAIPEAAPTLEEQRRPFAALRILAEQLAAAGVPCPELSMGMSADLEAALLEGATLLRIGSAVFGNRVGIPVRNPTNT